MRGTSLGHHRTRKAGRFRCLLEDWHTFEVAVVPLNADGFDLEHNGLGQWLLGDMLLHEIPHGITNSMPLW